MAIPNNRQQKLVEFARQFDCELRHGLVGVEAQMNNGDLSALGLDAVELEEIRKAESALKFLDGIRKIASQNSHETNIKQSTIAGLNPSEPIAESIQERFGRFEIIETIGQGGFARVFRARDPLLDREIALKVPRPNSLMSVEFRSRFNREAKAAAVLSHPAIIPIYETGMLGALTPYIASEYCEGENLAVWIHANRQAIDARGASEIVACLAVAVHHAHQRGIIHRDLKPANVLVQSGQGPVAGRLRITDFGLAKQIESDDDSITVDGSVIGTPAYMSPEQACGSKQVDAATDIFSLGVILYELLTGSLPFKQSSHLATIKAIESKTPVAPRRINSSIAVDLEAICLKCLNKSPHDRYASAHDLSQDLEAWLEGRDITARHATQFEKLVRWSRRNPALAGSLGFALSSMAIGFVVSLFLWQRSESNLRLSDSQRFRAQSHVQMLEATVDNVLDEYAAMIDDGAPLSDSHRRVLAEVLSVHEKLINAESDQLDVTDDTIAKYLRIIRIYRKTGEHEQARIACRQAERLVELMPLETEDQQRAVQCATIALRNEFGRIELESGNVSAAIDRFEHAANYLENHPAPGRIDAIEIYRFLGFAYTLDKKLDQALVARTEALRQAKTRLENDPNDWRNHLQVVTVTKDLGELFLFFQQRRKAIVYFQESLNMLVDISRNPDFSDADVRYRTAYIEIQLAEAMRRTKNFENVGPLLQLALARLEELIREQPEIVKYVMQKIHANRINVYYLHDIKSYEELKLALEYTIRLADANLGKEYSVRDQVALRNRYANILHQHFNESDKAVDVLFNGIERGILGLERFPYQQRIVDHVIRSYELLDIVENRPKE